MSPATWYHATTPAPPAFPPLDGDVRADVCIVGAGLTGLGAALALAGRGVRVVMLEAASVGLGASGRNGGQVHSGQRRDQFWLESRLGRDDAMALWRMAEDAKADLHRLMAAHGIDCHWRPGLIEAEHKPRHVEAARLHVEAMGERYGYDGLEFLDREALRALVASPDYHGGAIDRGAGHLDPLKLVRGLARAAAAAGVALHEDTPVTQLAPGAPARVSTPRGAVTADHVILAGDALMTGLAPEIDRRTLPIASTVAVTEPLGARLRAILTSDAAVSDSRFVVNYFRPTPDGRLLFGGGESYSTRPVADPGRLVRAAMSRVLPQLADVRFEHAWSGLVGITRSRLPVVRRLAPGISAAAGYSGHGLALAPYFGRLLGEAVAARPAALDVLERLPVPAFPGGPALRRPLLWAAMTWYALRDRL